MGFVTGFFGGITLTTSVLYLTVALHQRNRLEQAMILRQQALIMRNIIDPLPPAPLPTAREAKVGVFESAKDLWNGEIEGLVRKIQYTNWHEVRERLEKRASAVWHKTSAQIKDAGDAVVEKGKEAAPKLAPGVVRGREG